MWKKINESSEVTEDEILKDLEMAYRQLETAKRKLDQSLDVNLREKYERPIADIMDTLDYL